MATFSSAARQPIVVKAVPSKAKRAIMTRHWSALLTLLLYIGLAGGCAAPSPAQPPVDALAGRYSIKGGGSALPAVKSLTDAFSKQHPTVTFSLEDVGSDGGVALTAQGGADLGMISRDLKPAERGLVETLLVGVLGTGVVVHADNPVRALTRAQVRDIFSGVFTDWAQVGGQPGKISIFVREPEAATRSTFESYVFEGRAAYPSDAVQFDELDALFNGLRGLKNGVGMATTNDKTLNDPSVRFVAIDGVSPSRETIRSGTYAIRRPLFITFRSTDLKPAAQALLDFVRGPEGQALTANL
jgi:phosphate transport system substrate-binding protein